MEIGTIGDLLSFIDDDRLSSVKVRVSSANRNNNSQFIKDAIATDNYHLLGIIADLCPQYIIDAYDAGNKSENLIAAAFTININEYPDYKYKPVYNENINLGKYGTLKNFIMRKRAGRYR